MVAIYKILKRSEWLAAQAAGQFTGSGVDIRDGYIHFSTAEQAQETAQKHFLNQADLVVLAMESEDLGPKLVWEPSRGGALFPHLYAPLPVKHVREAHEAPLNADGVPDLKFLRQDDFSLREGPAAYQHTLVGLTPYNKYLLPTVERLLGTPAGRTLFEIGFGNGAVSNHLAGKGFKVSGIEASVQGLQLAHTSFPHLTTLVQGSLYEPLAQRFGRFSNVPCLEVIEHLYFPRRLAEAAFSLLEPGGTFVLSTIYHGYLKNIALALFGQFDRHYDPLWDHGHIKFFTRKTLTKLLKDAGFVDIVIRRPDIIPQFSRSMVISARRPQL